jgi:hypothetical protein
MGGKSAILSQLSMQIKICIFRHGRKISYFIAASAADKNLHFAKESAKNLNIKTINIFSNIDSKMQKNNQPFRPGGVRSRKAVANCFFSYPHNARYTNFVKKLRRAMRFDYQTGPSASKVNKILSELEALIAMPELSGTPSIEIWMANSIIWRALSSVLSENQLKNLVSKLRSNEIIETVLMDPRVLQIIEIEVAPGFLSPPRLGKCLPDDVKEVIWKDFGLDLSWQPRSFSVDFPPGIWPTENEREIINKVCIS